MKTPEPLQLLSSVFVVNFDHNYLVVLFSTLNLDLPARVALAYVPILEKWR